MPRPRKCRRVSEEPGITYFKPAGVPLRELSETRITVDELEALKLVDMSGMGQVDAAEKMRISQPTLNRLLGAARKKVAEALVGGQAIRIEGGDYYLR
ncbi:MAG: DUF134 domain-containing protein [Candidatus Micrarchaeota archaeon]